MDSKGDSKHSRFQTRQVYKLERDKDIDISTITTDVRLDRKNDNDLNVSCEYNS